MSHSEKVKKETELKKTGEKPPKNDIRVIEMGSRDSKPLTKKTKKNLLRAIKGTDKKLRKDLNTPIDLGKSE